MRKTMFLILGLAVLTVGLIVAGCGGADQQQTKAPAAKTEAPAPKTQAETAAAPAKAEAGKYPIDWCVVSGEKLGQMGDPVEYNYKGRKVEFCCKMCIPKFEAEPDRYIARLDSAAAGLITAGEPEGKTN